MHRFNEPLLFWFRPFGCPPVQSVMEILKRSKTIILSFRATDGPGGVDETWHNWIRHQTTRPLSTPHYPERHLLTQKRFLGDMTDLILGDGGASRVKVNFPELFWRELRWSLYDSYPDESDYIAQGSGSPRQFLWWQQPARRAGKRVESSVS